MVERQPRKRKPEPSRRQVTSARRAPRRYTKWILLGGAGLWGALAATGMAGLWPTVAVVLGTGAVALADRYSGRKAPVRRTKRTGGPDQVARESAPALRPNAVTEAYNTLPRSQSKPMPPAPVLRAPVAITPAIAAVKPPVTVEKPPSGAVRPPVVVEKPPVIGVVPPVVVKEPPAAVQAPPLVAEEPRVAVEELPVTVEELPVVVEELPIEVEELPVAVGELPVAVDELPIVEEELPIVEEELPIVVDELPIVVEELPIVEEEPEEPPIAESSDSYQLPSPSMLPVPPRVATITDDELIERGILLESTLRTFGVAARVIEISPGPAVTRYELQPAPGVRVNKFTQLADDIALALAAEDIRIEAPIPGKAAVGIEVPNKIRQMVPLREVLESKLFRNNPSRLTVALGKDNAGNPVIGDLSRMPHVLIAGSTGSGKSVCMNTIISSLLFKARPDEVKMLMIDPKMVELSTYNGIPHLMAPVITDVRKAAGYLKGAVKEMEVRYELFAAQGARNIEQYNRMNPEQPLPYIVIFIDELADLMMVAPADVEDAICRLAQMARACGMHLVIATQSPRVDVITGLIKANVPSRIAFAVSSQIDSRVIMDSSGAERLLGRGDMLYHPSGLPKPVRAQGAFIDEASVDQLVRFVRGQGQQPDFTAQEVAVSTDGRRSRGDDAGSASAADAAFPQAVRVVIEHGQASVSILQRRLRCNYSKAARLIDMMEERGYVGAHQGSKPRDVLIGMAQWQEEFGEE